MERRNRLLLLLSVCCFFVLLMVGCGVGSQNIVSGEAYEDEVLESAGIEMSLANAIPDVGPFYETVCCHSMLDVSDGVKMIGKELEETYYEILYPFDDFVEFIPTGTVDTYIDSKPQDVLIAGVGWSAFIEFDKDKYDIAEEDYDDFLRNEAEYFSSDQDIVIVYNGRMLGNRAGTAFVTVQYQDMVQYLRVTVGRKLYIELKRSDADN